MKVCVLGATGSVGRCCVRAMLPDSRVSLVTVVVRRLLSADDAVSMWVGPEATGVPSYMTKLQQKVVPDLDVFLKDTPESQEAKSYVKGHDAYISGLGLYSSSASEQEMRHLEVDINRAACQAAVEGGAKLGGVVSGMGAKSKAEGGSSIKFAKIKGEMEDMMAGLFPGMYGILETFLNKCMPWYANTSMGITAEACGRGLVQALLFENPQGRVVLENTDIQKAAARYSPQ